MAYLTRAEGEAAIDKVKYWYQVLVQHGFPVRPFTSIRFTDSLNYLGRCQQSRRTGEFRLSLSSAAFHGFDLDSIILHEYVHTIPGCMNHGPQFNGMAARIERLTGHYGITGTRQSARDKREQKGFTAAIAKYQLKCKKCGATWYYQRKGPAIKSALRGELQCSCGSREFTVLQRVARR